MAGIRVHGDRISFTLARPSPDFLERLALPYFCPVPRDTPILAGGVGVYTGPAPPGAGPYTFWGMVFNGEYAILKRNPNYGGSRPQRLDAIAFREGIDTEKAVGRVEQRPLRRDRAVRPLLAPGGEVARRFDSGQAARRRRRYRSFPQHVTAYLALNAARPPFSDPRLRRAVASGARSGDARDVANLTPTDRLLPPAVRGAGAPRVRPPTSPRAPTSCRHETRHRAHGRPVGRRPAAGSSTLVHAALAPLGVRRAGGTVADVGAALREPARGIQTRGLTTALDYPDPASFLAQMLGKDVPAAWLPRSIARRSRPPRSLTGPPRDRAALALATRVWRRP